MTCPCGREFVSRVLDRCAFAAILADHRNGIHTLLKSTVFLIFEKPQLDLLPTQVDLPRRARCVPIYMYQYHVILSSINPWINLAQVQHVPRCACLPSHLARYRVFQGDECIYICQLPRAPGSKSSLFISISIPISRELMF